MFSVVVGIVGDGGDDDVRRRRGLASPLAIIIVCILQAAVPPQCPSLKLANYKITN